jgi:DNA-binding MarR family transcriptional regulator
MKRRQVAELTRLFLLDELGRGGNVSQRVLAARLGIALGAVNRHVRSLIREGYVEITDPAVRPFAYRLTPAGSAYRQRLRQAQYERVAGSFREMEERIGARLRELKAKGVSRLVFYGAGVVMEVARPLAEALGLEVAGVIDDDPAKQGTVKSGLRVLEPAALAGLGAEAVVVTTFRHGRQIARRVGALLGARLLVWEL